MSLSYPDHLKLECLKLAVSRADYVRDVVDEARRYHDFLEGKKDAELVKAARDLAEKVGSA